MESKRFYCEHCEEEVSRTTFYSQYYDRTTRKWSKERVSYPGYPETIENYSVEETQDIDLDNYDSDQSDQAEESGESTVMCKSSFTYV